MILMIYVQADDYVSGRWKNWMEQMPVYLLTFLVACWDLLWFVKSDLRRPPKKLLAAFMVCTVLHIGVGGFVSAEFFSESDNEGFHLGSDQKELFLKALAHWVTVDIGSIFVATRMTVHTRKTRAHNPVTCDLVRPDMLGFKAGEVLDE